MYTNVYNIITIALAAYACIQCMVQFKLIDIVLANKQSYLQQFTTWTIIIFFQQ